MMNRWLWGSLIAVGTIAYLAVGWTVGLVVLVIALARVVVLFARLRRALRPSVPCPWCGRDVPQYGEVHCSECRMRGRGWVWRCGACATWFGHTRCPHCDLSVRNEVL